MLDYFFSEPSKGEMFQEALKTSRTLDAFLLACEKISHDAMVSAQTQADARYLARYGVARPKLSTRMPKRHRSYRSVCWYLWKKHHLRRAKLVTSPKPVLVESMSGLSNYSPSIWSDQITSIMTDRAILRDQAIDYARNHASPPIVISQSEPLIMHRGIPAGYRLVWSTKITQRMSVEIEYEPARLALMIRDHFEPGCKVGLCEIGDDFIRRNYTLWIAKHDLLVPGEIAVEIFKSNRWERLEGLCEISLGDRSLIDITTAGDEERVYAPGRIKGFSVSSYGYLDQISSMTGNKQTILVRLLEGTDGIHDIAVNNIVCEYDAYVNSHMYSGSINSQNKITYTFKPMFSSIRRTR